MLFYESEGKKKNADLQERLFGPLSLAKIRSSETKRPTIPLPLPFQVLGFFLRAGGYSRSGRNYGCILPSAGIVVPKKNHALLQIAQVE